MKETKIDERYGPVVAVVNSRSDPDKMYSVRSKDGTFSCNCKGWVFNREKPKRCRHTDAVARTSFRDEAVTICDELVLVLGIPVTSVTIERMAALLRPHLGMRVQVNVAATSAGGGLVATGRRLITLED